MNNVIPMYSNNVLLRTEHLTKLYTDGQVERAVGRERRDPPRRVRLHHGPQRQRQINAAEPARRPGFAHLRRTLLRRQAALQHPQPQPAAAQKFGFIFQSFYLLPVLTAVENVQVPMFEGSRLSASGRVKKAVELLDIVGLAHRLHHLPEQLSVGERQRVAIARALANDPVLLLADEPTGNLDSKSAIGIFELIEKLHRDRNMTIVLITHDDALGQRAERTVRIQDGRLKSDTRRGATPSAPAAAASHGSVAAPLPPLTSVPVSNLGSGPRAAGRPKSVLPPFAVQ